MEKLAKATVIDGIAATEDRDSQNEILRLDGADISQMTERGYFNDNHGSGFVNTLGRITSAKKIIKEADASDTRQKMYWNKVKRPFLYVKGYLFDEAEHPNAKAVASIMREFKKMGTPLDVQMSVEGKVKQRDHMDPTVLKESLIRNVALTLVPANSNTGSQIIDNVKKTIAAKCAEYGASQEFTDSLMKSVAVESISRHRGFIEIVDDVTNPWEALKTKVEQVGQLVKGLTAGYGAAGAPANRVGGAAVQKESLNRKLASTTVEDGLRSKRKQLFKNMIEQIRTEYPNLSYNDVVNIAQEMINKKMKGETDVTKS